jgi:NADH:ubiquinone oxidoreductase subunit 2 (subunit N)
MILLLSVATVPLIGALIINLPGDRRWRRFTPIVLGIELALAFFFLTRPGLLGSDTPLTLLGLTASLSHAGAFAIAIATLVVAIALATGEDALLTDEAVTGGLVALAGIALVSMLGESPVAAALTLGCVAAALLPTIAPPDAMPTVARASRRYVVWLALGSGSVLISGILDRFYERQPGPGILGPVAALFIIGIGITLAALPLSLWLPGLCFDAPIGAGLTVGILSAAAGSIVAGEIAANPWLFDEASARIALGAAGGFFGILSAVLALGERNPARSIGFLVSANADLALAGLAAAPRGDPAGFIWAFGTQALAAAVSLSCVGAVSGKIGGLAWRRPALAVSIAVAVMSLSGLPLTAGYVGRWLIASATVADHPVLVLETAIASAIAGLAGLRAFGPMVGRVSLRVGSPHTLDIVAVAIAASLILSGLFPGPILAALR